tara:strand:+ start:181 stop:816 length:636 start_codon:yes stop_codon:yes gene_type:complete
VDLIILGAGGHGKVVAEVASNLNKYSKIYFLDDKVNIDKEVLGSKVLNKIDFTYIKSIKKENNEFFVGIGDCKKRKEIQERLKNDNLNIATLIDPFTSISKYSEIGLGSLICPGVIVGPDSFIGEGAIINNSSTIDHDCIVGNYVHICPHSSIAGGVQFGNLSVLGTGARVIQGKKIGNNCLVGAGAVVTIDIKNNKKAIGIPAKLTDINL